MDNIAAG